MKEDVLLLKHASIAAGLADRMSIKSKHDLETEHSTWYLKSLRPTGLLPFWDTSPALIERVEEPFQAEKEAKNWKTNIRRPQSRVSRVIDPVTTSPVWWDEDLSCQRRLSNGSPHGKD